MDPGSEFLSPFWGTKRSPLLTRFSCVIGALFNFSLLLRGLALVLLLLGLASCEAPPSDSTSSSADNESASSEVLELTPPSHLTATASSGKVVLEWDPVEAADSYTIYWSLTASARASKVVYDLKEPTYTHLPSENGLIYYYRVAAVSGDQSSPISSPVQAVPLEAPAHLQATFEAGALHLSWDAVAGARSYELSWSNAEGAEEVLRNLSETEYVHEGVEAGLDYTYTVRACYDRHQSDAAPLLSVRPLTSPVLQPLEIGDGRVRVSWNPVTGAEGYRLAHDNGSQGAQWVDVDTEAAHWDGSLPNGRTYSFRVAAIHGEDQSPWSPEVPGTPLQTPDNLSVAVGDGQVWLQWNPVPEAHAYVVEADNGSGDYEPLPETVTGEDEVLEGLENGRTYSFRVRAAHPTGQSDPSLGIPAIPLQSPKVQEVQISTQQVELQWQEAVGAEHYQLQWTTSEDASVQSKVVEVPYFVHDEVEAGVTYFYQIFALNSTGSSSPDTVQATPLGAPERLQGTAGNAQVSLTWKAVKSAEQYEVHRSFVHPPDFSGEAIAVTEGLSWLEEPVANGASVSYAVRALRAGLPGPFSETVTVQPSAALPRAPVVQAQSASGQVTLSWEAVPGASSYTVSGASAPGGEVEETPVTVSSGTSWSETGLTNGEARFYRVRSWNASGGSAFSQEVSSVPLATPEGLKADAGNRAVTLSWSPVSGAEAYRVERRSGNLVWETVASPETTSFVDTGLTNGEAVVYRLQALAGSDKSASSAEVEATPRLPPPEDVSVTAGNRAVTLSWSPVSGATRYRVYWSSTSGVTLDDKQASTQGTGFTQTELVNCQARFFRVQATGPDDESDLSAEVEALPRIPDSSDPLFVHQWYLKNTGQKAFSSEYGTPGADIHLQGQASCYDGRGVMVAVVDNGLDLQHEDLKDNLVPGGSWDFREGDTDPSASDGYHGTAVAGVIAAVNGNGIGGRGVAPGAQLVGYNYLKAQGESSFIKSVGGSTKEPNSAIVDIFNMSFGLQLSQDQQYTDDNLRIQALRDGFMQLRGGKGAIYLQAGGNGFFESVVLNCGPARSAGLACQNTNMSPYAVTPYVLQVGAVDANGRHAGYSASGSNLWISAPGGGYGHDGTLLEANEPLWDCNEKPGFCGPALVTTDQEGCSAGFSTQSSAVDPPNAFDAGTHALNRRCNYTSTFNGSSAATAVVSGVVALMLEANPDLTARQVKHVLAQTAQQVDPTNTGVSLSLAGGTYLAEPGWQVNAAGFSFHNWYGFGAVDADAAIEASLSSTLRTFTPMQVCPWRSSGTVGLPIPDHSVVGAADALTVPDALHFVEGVQVEVTASHTHIGDLGVELESPSGTRSVLLNVANGFLDKNLNGMTLLSNAFYGESGSGTWTLKLVDGLPEDTGTLEHWRLRLIGEGTCGS